MSAVYVESSEGWRLVPPAGFPDERNLQEIVSRSPDILPLSSQPQVAVLGREVRLGSGYVDVLAIESTGHPVLIEIKLRNNAESRRAVVAQVLSYAAALHRMSVEELEKALEKNLRGQSLFERMRDSFQAQLVEEEEFYQNLHDALQNGGFRLVLVLDDAPDELVQLVGYLEAVVQEELYIDLIVVSSYDIGGQRVVVPQRVEPDRPPTTPYERGDGATARGQETTYERGFDLFREHVSRAPDEHRPVLESFLRWAERIEAEQLAGIGTYRGRRGAAVMLPRLPDGAGLTSLYCRPNGQPAVQLWRSVFERMAPRSIAEVRAAIGGAEIGQGSMAPVISDALLDALLTAYREAAATSGWRAPADAQADWAMV